jgi:hypothetical protein
VESVDRQNAALTKKALGYAYENFIQICKNFKGEDIPHALPTFILGLWKDVSSIDLTGRRMVG